MIPSVIAELERAHEKLGLSWRELCTDVPYATLMRWKQRLRSAQPMLRRPGPKKAQPLDPQFFHQLTQLGHGRSRSVGTTALYQQFSSAISRRQVQALARQMRRDKDKSMKRIHWLRSNLAWAIDATEYQGWKVIPLHDLSSRYRVDALLTQREEGWQIAQFLQQSFHLYGAPLIFKRDNGSPFNNQHVDQILAKHWVIPLNSPPCYPCYNGAMEKSIRDLKEALDRRAQELPPTELSSHLEASLHQLNHRPRRCLKGLTPCGAFYDPKRRLHFPVKMRRPILRLLQVEFLQTIASMNLRSHHHLAAAWRLTVENWLRRQNLIAINRNQKPKENVSTIFPKFWSHN
jgi:transposase InsO family protein